VKSVFHYDDCLRVKRNSCAENYLFLHLSVIVFVVWWRYDRMSDLRWRGCGFDFWSGLYQVDTIWMADCLRTSKLFTYITNTKV